jgi:hypothetical protein
MDIDPPYRLDPFQNIIDVHWIPTATGECQDSRYAITQNPGVYPVDGAILYYADEISFENHLAPSHFVETWYVAETLDMRSITQPETGLIGWTNNEWINYFNFLGGTAYLAAHPGTQIFQIGFYHPSAQAIANTWWDNTLGGPRPGFILLFLCERVTGTA